MSDPPMGRSGPEYSAADVALVSPIEAARRRPGMYIGSTDTEGLHEMLWSVVGNGLNRRLAGRLDHLAVRLNADGSATVAGRGPRASDAELTEDGRRLEHLLTSFVPRASAGRPDAPTPGYRAVGAFSDDLLCAVNALSRRLTVDVRHAGNRWTHREYERGVLRHDVERDGATDESDSTLTFWPDATIFGPAALDYDRVVEQLRAVCYLNPRLTIEVVAARHGATRGDTLHYPDGVAAYVRHLNAHHRLLRPPIGMGATLGSTRVDVALQYNAGDGTNVLGYVNNHHTERGGTHLVGFYDALAHILNTRGHMVSDGFGKDVLEGKTLTRDDVRCGLTALVSVWLAEPLFEGALRPTMKRVNAELKDQVAAVVSEGLIRHFEQAPDDLAWIIHQCLYRSYAWDWMKRQPHTKDP